MTLSLVEAKSVVNAAIAKAQELNMHPRSNLEVYRCASWLI
jgi:hypothetical protein